MDRVEHPVLLVGSVMTKDMTAAQDDHRIPSSLAVSSRTTEFCKLHECLAPWQQAPAAFGGAVSHSVTHNRYRELNMSMFTSVMRLPL